MPRSVSGNYTLPLPPVVANTVIQAAWANTTQDDIAQAMTDSLDRYGRGGMVAPFRLVDGAVSVPAWAFNAETGTGMYREGNGILAVSVQGAKVAEWTTAGYAVDGLFATDDISANTVTANAFLGGYIRLTTGEAVSMIHPQGSIVWRNPPEEEPPGIVVGRTTGRVLVLRGLGGISFQHSGSGIEYLNGSTAFNPSADGVLDLGAPGKGWRNFHMFASMFITSPTSTAVQYIKITTLGGSSFFAHDNNVGSGMLAPSPGPTALCVVTENARNIALGTSNVLRVLVDGSSPTTTFGNVNATTPLVKILGNTTGRPTMRLDNGSQIWNTSLKSDIGQNWYFIANPAESIGVYMTPSAAGWNNISDARHKAKWKELDSALDKLMTLHAGTFRNKADLKLPRDVGLLAQDVRAILPEAVDTSDPDRLGMRYHTLIPLLVKAVQELAAATVGKALPKAAVL